MTFPTAHIYLRPKASEHQMEDIRIQCALTSPYATSITRAWLIQAKCAFLQMNEFLV